MPTPLFDVAKIMFSEKLKCECYLVTIFHILTWYQKYQDLHNIVTAHRYVLDSPVSSLKKLFQHNVANPNCLKK